MLTREACEAWRDMGGPQTLKWPQWIWMCDDDHDWECYPIYDPLGTVGRYWVACPSEVEALDWLAAKLDIYWTRRWDGVYAVSDLTDDIKEAISPSDLVIAIGEHWQARQKETQVGPAADRKD